MREKGHVLKFKLCKNMSLDIFELVLLRKYLTCKRNFIDFYFLFSQNEGNSRPSRS